MHDDKITNRNQPNDPKNLWGSETDGDPIWYVLALVAVGIYFGFLAEAFSAGDVLVNGAFAAAMVSICLLHLVSRRSGQ